MTSKEKLKAKAKVRAERYEASQALVESIELSDLKSSKELYLRYPALHNWVPYEATGWSQIAAAAGQLKVLKYFMKCEKTTRKLKKPISLESLLFWTMGYEFIQHRDGNPVQVAKYLLKQGANIDGDSKDFIPLHRAVFMNRPKLVELLIKRGADLTSRYATGITALQIARRNMLNNECAILLERAGAPAELPKKPDRPKPIRTIDLKESRQKLQAGLEKAIRNFTHKHPRESISAIALASIPHEGYVMLSFETGEFEGSPWDCLYNEFAYIKFPDWIKAHDNEKMQLIDTNGRSSIKEPEAFHPQFMKMIIDVLKSLEKCGYFNTQSFAKGCKIGIEMTVNSDAKFWKIRKS